MFHSATEFEAQINKISSPYSLRDRFRRSSHPGVSMYAVETKDGRRFKWLKQTKQSSACSDGGPLRSAHKNLNLYEGSSATPAIRFADGCNLVVDWVDGVAFSDRHRERGDYAMLGDFTPRGFRQIETYYHSCGQGLRELENILGQCGKFLDESLTLSLLRVLEGAGGLDLAFPYSAVCFGDSANKNFLAGVQEQLVYIDILGIYRKPIGVVFAKQLCMIPTSHRRTFFNAYVAAVSATSDKDPQALVRDLPMHLAHFVSAKALKGVRASRWRMPKRAKVAASILSGFSRVDPREESVMDWILDRSEVMI